MLRILTAYTREIDDVDAAVSGILGQLDLEQGLLKNSVGLLFNYLDFIDSGVVEALCGRLPFDVIGCTSQNFAVPEAAEEIMLSLTVLTSDKIVFSAGVSEPLDRDEEERIEALYRRLASGRDPSLIFLFVPTLKFSPVGDMARKVLDRAAPGIPQFGSGALDVPNKIRTPMTIYNGGAYQDRLALLLFFGEVNFKFFSITFPGQKTIGLSARITAAKGNRIISLDNRPAVEYLEKIGLYDKGNINMAYAFPVIVDFHDGSEPKTWNILNVNDDGSLNSFFDFEDGVPEGSTISLTTATGELVLETASRLAEMIKKEPGSGGVFIFSCFSRSVIFLDSRAEINHMREELKDFTAPYLMMSAAGEYCPYYSGGGQMVNRSLVHSIIACIFKE
ncbi:MAG: FIST C-terminal domain-containing protein [Treponema sp.]|jgi:hypothetical protein|nr:FIST C-terminal domain-containing protein [Treponema sp.]